MQTTRLPPSHTAGRERTRLREGTALLRVPARLHRPKRHPPPQLNSFHLTDSDLAAGTLAAGTLAAGRLHLAELSPRETSRVSIVRRGPILPPGPLSSLSRTQDSGFLIRSSPRCQAGTVVTAAPPARGLTSRISERAAQTHLCELPVPFPGLGGGGSSNEWEEGREGGGGDSQKAHGADACSFQAGKLRPKNPPPCSRTCARSRLRHLCLLAPDPGCLGSAGEVGSKWA